MMPPLRFADLEHASRGTRDFVTRRRLPTIAQLLIIFVIALLLSLGVAALLASASAVIAALVVIFSFTGTYVATEIQRARDLVLTTEFQNSMFASALGMNSKFSLIIRTDGSIVYVDRPFQDMFPDFMKKRSRTLAALLTQAKVGAEDREKIFSAVTGGVYDKVIFDIHADGGQAWRIVMAIEPIQRPAGFILLRSRDYVERSSATPAAPGQAPVPLLNKANITLFAHVMDTMNMGVYMTDPGGNIIYANDTLEQWLAYREGEINSSSFALQDIIHNYGDAKRKDFLPEDFEGEAVFQKKAGGLVHGYVNQKIIRSEEGRILGCAALIQHIAETDAAAKKKLW